MKTIEELNIKPLTEKDVKKIKSKKDKELEKVDELYFQAVKVDKCQINSQNHTHLIAKDKKDISHKKWLWKAGIITMSFITISALLLSFVLLYKLFF